MMNYLGHAAASPWCYRDDASEAAGAAASSSFADLIADYSTDDLFDLACRRSGTMLPAADVWTPLPPDDERFDPPSEVEMAAWLRAIVQGEDHAINDGGGDGGRQQTAGARDVEPEKERPSDTSSTMTADKEEKLLPMAEGMGSTKQEMRKLRAGGSSRRSHHGETHNLIEKRRRHKINERFRTLQRLVPGCDDKSNQAATLDQTILYMRSLQHHLKAMSSDSPTGPAAPYPVVPPQYVPPVAPPAATPTMPLPTTPMMVLAPTPGATMVVPFGAMVQLLPHYPAAAVMMPAAAAPQYPATTGLRQQQEPAPETLNFDHQRSAERI